MSKPKVYMLHGFLGVGKTTLAKILEREQNAIRFTHDEWMSRLYGEDPPTADFQEYAARIFAVMEGVWTRCLELGTSVVLDFGFWSRSEREHVRQLASRHVAESVLYRLTCREDVAWKRIERRNRGLAGSLYISPSTYQSLKARFEPLEPDEHCVDLEG